MKAIAITPGRGEPHLIDMDEPEIKSPDDVKLKVLQVGICGTDREEVEGGRAAAPQGEDHLIIGHEMFGRVVEKGSGVNSVRENDYALFMVRRPCMRCQPCLHGRSDMCKTGMYKERGIKELHGYQAEFVVDREKYLIKVPEEIKDIAVLTEPASVIVKAIEESAKLQITRLSEIYSDSYLKGKKALIAGLGPIGLLSAFVLKLRGAEIFGLDIVDENSPRPEILKKIDGTYINGNKTNADEIDDKYGKMDFILDATGIAKLEFQLLDALGINGVYVLTGIPAGERPLSIAGSAIIRQMVLKNQLLLGSVNAALEHYKSAVEDLAEMKKRWPEQISRVITHRIPYKNFNDALTKHSEDEIKTVIEWGE